MKKRIALSAAAAVLPLAVVSSPAQAGEQVSGTRIWTVQHESRQVQGLAGVVCTVERHHRRVYHLFNDIQTVGAWSSWRIVKQTMGPCASV